MDEQPEPQPNRTGKVLAVFLAVFLLATAGYTVWIILSIAGGLVGPIPRGW